MTTIGPEKRTRRVPVDAISVPIVQPTMTTAIENERNELKPCPFCGSVPEMRWWSYLAGKELSVSCENNECLGASFQNADPEKAIAQWNRRQP